MSVTIRNVFISGANRGLGFALAKRFLREGAQVFGGTRGTSAELTALAEDTLAGTLTIVPLDVTRSDSVREAAARVARYAPALDLLINNAAVQFERPTPLETLDLDALPFQTTLDVNALGPLRMVQQFLPLLKNGERKLIINISSEAGSIADCWRESEFAYCMSKAALNMQTRLLHNHLKPHGVQIVAVQPGWMRTDMGGANAELHPDESAQGIFEIAQKVTHDSGGAFIDHRGQPLRW